MDKNYHDIMEEFNKITSGSPFNISLKIINGNLSFLFNRLGELDKVREYIVRFYYNHSFFETLTLRSRDLNNLFQSTHYIIEIEKSKQKIDSLIRYRCFVDFNIINEMLNAENSLVFDEFLYLYFKHPSMYKPLIDQLITTEEREKIKGLEIIINENQKLLSGMNKIVHAEPTFYFNRMNQEPQYMDLF